MADQGVRVPEPSHGDAALIQELYQLCGRMKKQLAQVIIGQESVIDEVLIAVFSRGHALLVGVPAGPVPEEVDAIVVALKSRTTPAPEAVAESLAALAWLRARCGAWCFPA